MLKAEVVHIFVIVRREYNYNLSTTSVATRQLVVWKLSTEDIQCPQGALHHAEGLSCLSWKGVSWWRQVTQ